MSNTKGWGIVLPTSLAVDQMSDESNVRMKSVGGGGLFLFICFLFGSQLEGAGHRWVKHLVTWLRQSGSRGRCFCSAHVLSLIQSRAPVCAMPKIMAGLPNSVNLVQ
jgi:hypothetical protein